MKAPVPETVLIKTRKYKGYQPLPHDPIVGYSSKITLFPPMPGPIRKTDTGKSFKDRRPLLAEAVEKVGFFKELETMIQIVTPN